MTNINCTQLINYDSMKRYNIFKLWVLNILILFGSNIYLTSCEDLTEEAIIAINFVPIDTVNTPLREDNLITAEAQDFVIGSMYTSSCPLDWKHIITQLWVIDEYVVHSRDSIDYIDQWYDLHPIKTGKGEPIECDWIRFEIIKDTIPVALKISVKENNTNKQRAAMFSLTETNDKGFISRAGEIVIVQKPAIDATPFKVQLRYKGELYETEASLNENEELVFQNDEVTELMAMLRAKPGVETVLMDSEIVDFIDKEDLDKEPLLAALGARNGMQRVSCPSHPGNWNAGFRFMETGAVGYCALFDDNNFSDTYFVKNLTSRYSVFDVLDMHKIGLNDKVSSVAVAYEATDNDVCAVLTLWEDDNFNYGDDNRSKHRISVIATPNNAHVWRANLNNVPCLGSSKSWNDRASSFSFHFGRVGTQLKDY